MEPTQQPQFDVKNTKDNAQMIPLAIVAAGALIAAAIYFGGSAPSGKLIQGNTNDLLGNNQPAPSADVQIEPVTDKDHIVGNKNADVVVVEYSDLECPFCKSFHETMKQIMQTYDNGKVAWVYRQFPLYQPDSSGRALHPKAGKEAEASECAAELGGNTKFWEFINGIFAITPSNNGLDAAELPKMAASIGLDVTTFNNCLNSGKYTKLIEADVIAAQKAGAQGTPYSIAIAKNGQKVIINGAESFQTVKSKIDSLLK